MDTVKTNGINYVVTTPASTDINESFVAGKTEPVISVSGEGYRADDVDQAPVEIVWYVDNPDAQDSENLVDDWDTADEANLL